MISGRSLDAVHSMSASSKRDFFLFDGTFHEVYSASPTKFCKNATTLRVFVERVFGSDVLDDEDAEILRGVATSTSKFFPRVLSVLSRRHANSTGYSVQAVCRVLEALEPVRDQIKWPTPALCLKFTEAGFAGLAVVLQTLAPTMTPASRQAAGRFVGSSNGVERRHEFCRAVLFADASRLRTKLLSTCSAYAVALDDTNLVKLAAIITKEQLSGREAEALENKSVRDLYLSGGLQRAQLQSIAAETRHQPKALI